MDGVELDVDSNGEDEDDSLMEWRALVDWDWLLSFIMARGEVVSRLEPARLRAFLLK